MRTLILFPLLLIWSLAATAADNAPWGTAADNQLDIDYAPQKVLYDVTTGSREYFERVLDRVSYLNKLYGADPFDASIILVLHGDEIPFFALENQTQYYELMRRARSLTVGGIIEFRMCRIAARGHGYEPKDIHGFVKMVPMADAEIVRLQREKGYAYMQ